MTNPARGSLLLLTCSALSCALPSGPRETSRSMTHVGLSRGATSSSLAMALPYLFGPSFTLRLESGKLTGWSSGTLAATGALRVHIERDGAHGQGVDGSVALHFVDEEDHTLVEGLWNGRQVRLEFSAQSIQGTVSDSSDRGWLSGPEHAGSNGYCHYRLDGVDRQGGYSGRSVCKGMPVETRLVIPPLAHTLLTRAELLTVVICLLSSPPTGRGERLSPEAPYSEALGFAHAAL